MRRRTDRDTLVTKGLTAKMLSESSEYQKGPWIYKYIVKSGRSRSQMVEKQYTNIAHLVADAVIGHAKPEEALNVFGITRVMKAQARSVAEDI